MDVRVLELVEVLRERGFHSGEAPQPRAERPEPRRSGKRATRGGLFTERRLGEGRAGVPGLPGLFARGVVAVATTYIHPSLIRKVAE